MKKHRKNSTRDEFTKWLELEETMEQQKEMTEVTPEDAPAEETAEKSDEVVNTTNAGAEAKKQVNDKFAKILIVVMLIIFALIVVITGISAIKKRKANEKVYAQFAEDWDSMYNNKKYLRLYSCIEYEGEYVLIINERKIPNCAVTKAPLPHEPDWVKQGLEDALDGKHTEMALFACKYYMAESEISAASAEQCRALGIGYFENNSRLTDEQYTKCLQSLCYHLVN